MNKKIRIAGTECLRKHLSEIVVSNRMAAVIRNKEQYVFNAGIVCVKFGNGTTEKYYVGQEKSGIFSMVFYDTGVNEEQRIYFFDEMLNVDWESVFVYFFDDEEGAYTLFAEHHSMNVIGALYAATSEYGSFVSQMALNVAYLMESTLLEEILDMERAENKREVSLIVERR